MADPYAQNCLLSRFSGEPNNSKHSYSKLSDVKQLRLSTRKTTEPGKGFLEVSCEVSSLTNDSFSIEITHKMSL